MNVMTRAVSTTAAAASAAIGASMAALWFQAREASETIEAAARNSAIEHGMLVDRKHFNWQDEAPNGDGVYLPDGTLAAAGAHATDGAEPVRRLAVMGDSTSVGYGCTSPDQVPGVLLARGAAAARSAAVELTTYGVIGAISADLDRQAARVVAEHPDAAVIMVGANDVRDRIPPRRAADQLERVVAELTLRGIAVVVGTCPDLGVIVPIHQPLRRIAGVWSRRLARLQERAVTRAGGVPVALDRLVSPDFYGRPDLFYVDGFHPSGLGYAKATAALTPAVIDALR